MEHGLTLEQIIGFLLETPLFSALEADGLADIVGIMQLQRFREGQVVFHQDDEGDAWYVVYSGSVEVSWEGGFGRARQVAELEEKSCFGEMAILDGSPRSATVSASADCLLLRFPRGAFQDLLEEGNLAAFQLVLGMARVLSERQRRLTDEVQGMLDEAQDTPRERRRRMRDLIASYRVSE